MNHVTGLFNWTHACGLSSGLLKNFDSLAPQNSLDFRGTRSLTDEVALLSCDVPSSSQSIQPISPLYMWAQIAIPDREPIPLRLFFLRSPSTEEPVIALPGVRDELYIEQRLRVERAHLSLVSLSWSCCFFATLTFIPTTLSLLLNRFISAFYLASWTSLIQDKSCSGTPIQ
jgi:hypothetical protein